MSFDRRAVLAAFIRSQAALVSLPGGKVVQGVGDVRLNNDEALLAAEALEESVTGLGSLEVVIQHHVEATLKAYNGDKRLAAEWIGISLKTLYNYLHKWGRM